MSLVARGVSQVLDKSVAALDGAVISLPPVMMRE